MSKPLDIDDPAYWMLQRGLDEASGAVENTGWVSSSEVFNERCYICTDPEFALMGLPLCYPCKAVVGGVRCGKHVAADDTVCDDGHDSYEGDYDEDE